MYHRVQIPDSGFIVKEIGSGFLFLVCGWRSPITGDWFLVAGYWQIVGTQADLWLNARSTALPYALSLALCAAKSRVSNFNKPAASDE